HKGPDAGAPPTDGGGAVDQYRGPGEEEEEAEDVVARLAGLVEHQAGVEHDCPSGERPYAPPVGPADAPGRGQAATHAEDVEQRRKQVALEEGHPDPVQELRVLGVEPSQVAGRDGGEA